MVKPAWEERAKKLKAEMKPADTTSYSPRVARSLALDQGYLFLAEEEKAIYEAVEASKQLHPPARRWVWRWRPFPRVKTLLLCPLCQQSLTVETSALVGPRHACTYYHSDGSCPYEYVCILDYA